MADWKAAPALRTRWTNQVGPEHCRPEYPRPQLVRPHWQNLNGLWEFAVTSAGLERPAGYEGRILVPFPIESALSGVERALKPDQRLWYRREFAVEQLAADDRIILHFGAVDFEAKVWLNNVRIGDHRGGYQSFSFDITEHLNDDLNELVVEVWDPTDRGPNPYGKQRLDPEWAFYKASSGIWQTVWLERAPAIYVCGLRLVPDLDASCLHLSVDLNEEDAGATVEATVSSAEGPILRQLVGQGAALKLPDVRTWSPEAPFLYDLEIKVRGSDGTIDLVKSYFGMRKVEIARDSSGAPRILLNGKATYNLGIVDQGFWPDGLHSAPSDSALRFDVEAVKALGFNAVRKHIKIEDLRWYAHCDRLGLLVWQDMPSGNNDSPEGRAQFEAEVSANVAQLHNHPSIIVWGLFNEGWGAYDEERLTASLKAMDPTRLVNAHSGPYDQLLIAQAAKRRKPAQLPGPRAGTTDIGEEFQKLQLVPNWPGGDMVDHHIYPGPRMPPAPAGIAAVTGEHGSFGCFISGHVEDELRPLGTGLGAMNVDPSQLEGLYADTVDQLALLADKGLAASFYFQLADVEVEQQGFLTYDREIAKLDPKRVASLNARLVPTTGQRSDLPVALPQTLSEAAVIKTLLAAVDRPDPDRSKLRRLALLSQRAGQGELAVDAACRFAAASPEPWSRDVWRLLAAVTARSDDAAFQLLKDRNEEANAQLGANGPERAMLRVIAGEFVDPALRDRTVVPDWAMLIERGQERYGALGAEAVQGAQMMCALVAEDWPEFGRCYAHYYAVANGRSGLADHALAWRVLKHVDSEEAVEHAVAVMGQLIERGHDFKFGRYDPSELDTYARLLARAGRLEEARKWQALAVDLCKSRDATIVRHLNEMLAAAKTARR